MKTKMNIPPLDLKRQYETIKDEVQSEIARLCDSQAFILGDAVTDFENSLKDFCNSRFAIGVSSGTDAITLALMALDITHGDEVITTPFTFIATAEPITLLGARPVFVDINPDTFNIDPKAIESKITDKTKAIIVVHLYGQVADMAPILRIAKEKNIKVIEDNAQAMGSTYGKTGEQAGSMGDFGTLSFFPSKNLGGFGDGGAVLTQDETLASKIKMLRVHGQEKRYYHDAIGLNARLDALQAVILSVKLKHLSVWLKERNLKGRIYDEMIQKKGLDSIVQVPVTENKNYHTYHQYVLKTETKRDELVEYLQSEGIGSRIYYPVPLHLQKCFQELGYKEGDLPASEQCSKEIFSLPIFPEITQNEQEYVVEKIAQFQG